MSLGPPGRAVRVRRACWEAPGWSPSLYVPPGAAKDVGAFRATLLCSVNPGSPLGNSRPCPLHVFDIAVWCVSSESSRRAGRGPGGRAVCDRRQDRNTAPRPGTAHDAAPAAAPLPAVVGCALATAPGVCAVPLPPRWSATRSHLEPLSQLKSLRGPGCASGASEGRTPAGTVSRTHLAGPRGQRPPPAVHVLVPPPRDVAPSQSP